MDKMLWIFGYGSLIWKPPEGFTPVQSIPGGIKGWHRRFWQGSTDHRGLPGAPGLVATLLKTSDLPDSEKSSCGDDTMCWGMCYGYDEKQKEDMLAYLDYREKDGYDRCLVEVYLRREDGTTSTVPDIHEVLLYVATTGNPQYLGPLTNEQAAAQIARSAGPSGTNAEYLFKAAEGLRRMEVVDDHVFDLENRVKELPMVSESAKVSAFVGDGKYEGDGGWMLQKLWDLYNWKEDSEMSGVFKAGELVGETADLLGKIGWPKSMSTVQQDVRVTESGDWVAACVARFPCGGALVALEQDGVTHHLLLTESAIESAIEARSGAKHAN